MKQIKDLSTEHLRLTSYSQVGFSYNGSIMKLQLFSANDWGFVNLSRPMARVNRSSMVSQPQIWIEPNFQSAHDAVETLLRSYPKLKVYLFENLKEFLYWAINQSDC